MNHILNNGILNVTVSDLGAEIVSATKNGREYIWNGDTQYWPHHAPILFPVVGRLQDCKFTANGQTYTMGIHGFAKDMHWEVMQTPGVLTFLLTDTDETRRHFPWQFAVRVQYALKDSTLFCNYGVQNLSDDVMYFALGTHTGFSVPLCEDERFEDYYLEFPGASHPDRILFSENLLLNGQKKPFALKDERRLPLSHSLFDQDAIFLADCPRTVKLCTKKRGCGVEMAFPDFGYLGIWHTPKTDAPFLCLEPCTALPGRDGVRENISARSDYRSLYPGRRFNTKVAYTFF